jgi:hypothetical protein
MAQVYSHALGETQKILAREKREKKNLMIISKDQLIMQVKPGNFNPLKRESLYVMGGFCRCHLP